MNDMKRYALCSGVAALAALQTLANVWYTPTDAVDGRSWARTSGWSIGSLPTLATEDDVAVNNATISPSYPLVIPTGTDAKAKVCLIGSSATVPIGLRMEAGATLETATHLVLGYNTGNTGVFTIAGGTWYLCSGAVAYSDKIGYWGTGVVTNLNGTYSMPKRVTDRSLKLGVSVTGSGLRSSGTWVQHGGTIEGDWSNSIHIGCQGDGLMELYGGTVSGVTMLMGTENGGKGRVVLDGATISPVQIGIGWTAGSFGEFEFKSGSIVQPDWGWRVGNEGNGRLDFTGGKLADSAKYTLDIGYLARGVGEVNILQSPHTNRDRTSGGLFNTINVGMKGTGMLNVNDSATTEYLKVGAGGLGKSGTVTVGASGWLRVLKRLDLGGVVSTEGTLDGKGLLKLRGGTVAVSGSADKANPTLYIGRTADSFGSIRGYGYVMGWSWESNNFYMKMGNGAIVGDGEGDERVLDLTSIVNVETISGLGNGATGTNGWYAVNKGAVYFPRTWFGSGGTYGFGCDKPAKTPDFVNSLVFNLPSASKQNHMCGGVMATDRSDLHLDSLPPHRGVIDVWKLGVFDSTVDGNPVPFSGLSLKIRYDQTKVASADKLALYRYAGGRWTKVGKTTVAESAATHTISTTKAMDSDAAQTYNAGIIALVKDVSGLSVLVR